MSEIIYLYRKNSKLLERNCWIELVNIGFKSTEIRQASTNYFERSKEKRNRHPLFLSSMTSDIFFPELSEILTNRLQIVHQGTKKVKFGLSTKNYKLKLNYEPH